MNIDLEQELARVARSVHDDAAADRMSGQVRTMVGRIKRRRAARHTATGVLSVGAVTAIALGGVQLAGRPGPVAPPAASGPTGTAEPDVCATTVTDPDPTAQPVALGVDAPTTSDGVIGATLDVTVSFTGRVDQIGTLEGDPELVVTRDGVVVSPPATLDATQESMPPTYLFSQALTVCGPGGADPAGLPDGQYELRATQWVTLPGETEPVQLVGTAPLTIDRTAGAPDGTGTDPEAEPEATTEDEQRALVQIEAWVAAPVANPEGVFPRCGTLASEVIDDGMPALELDLLADPALLAEPGGATVPGAVVLKTTEGRYAIGNAAPLARLVLLSDGVVVGYQFLDSEELVTIDLADGETMPFDLRTTTALCGTGEGGQGEQLPLPAGEYTAVAALDILVKEVGGPGQEADGRTYPVTAVSEPVTVRIG